VSPSANKLIGSLAVPLVVALAMGSCARLVASGGEAAGGGHGGGDPQPCGTPVVSGTGADGTVSYRPCDSAAPPVPRPQIVEPTPGMTDVHARPFDHAKVADDDVTVNVDLTSGVEPCSVLDHVDVSYGANAVTITLYEGYDASAGQVACIDIAVFKRVVVTLDQPLDGRKIVDGAA
jgi:hypothetical protein